MLTAGRLTGPRLQIGEQAFQTGDRIVCLRNHRRVGVVNGTRATITAIDPTRRTIHATDDHGNPLQLPADYLDAGHLAHGYAITGHKAQGLTVDHTYVLGSPELYREWGYVAMSRGRHTNQLYHGPGDRLDGLHEHTHLVADPSTTLASGLRRRRAQEPLSDSLAETARQWRQIQAELDALDFPRHQSLLRRRDELRAEQQRLLGRADRVRDRITHASGGILRPRGRQTIAELNEELDRLRDRSGVLEAQLGQVEAKLAAFPTVDELRVLYNRQEQLDTILRDAAERRIRSSRQPLPDYLVRAVGHRPATGRAQERWERTAIAIEDHRLRWTVTDSRVALGPPVADRAQSLSRDHVASEIAATVREIAHPTAQAHRR